MSLILVWPKTPLDSVGKRIGITRDRGSGLSIEEKLLFDNHPNAVSAGDSYFDAVLVSAGDSYFDAVSHVV